MKKSLLLGVALSATVGMFAQNNRAKMSNAAVKISKNKDIEAYVPDVNLKPTVSNTAKVNTPPYTLFSQTRNNYGYYVSQLQTILTYNPDLNAVLYTQRFGSLWANYNALSAPTGLNPAAGAGASGYMVGKWTTDNGQTWDSTLLYRNDVNWARFPSGTIYNPTGNTDLNNALIVASGPTTPSAGGWSGNWFASAHMTNGTNGVQGATNKQRWYATNNTDLSAFGKNISFGRSYSTVNNGTVWVGGVKSKNNENLVYGVALVKGTYSAAGDSMVWGVDSSLVNKWIYDKDGEANCSEPKIAFGPDGQTGYVVVNGCDSAETAVNIRGSYQPMVWKTTDAGATWNRVNQGFDWTTAGGGKFIQNLRPTGIGNTTIPAFFDTYGGEIAVDANGVLHYVTAVTPAFSTHRDSAGYGFTYPFGFEKGFCDDRPWVWDLTTNGSGSWDGKLVAQLYTNKTGSNTATDTTSGNGVWLDQSPNTHTEHDARIQLTRSVDGSKLFISWLESDTTVVVGQNQYGFNNLPSVHFRGYDAASGTYTPEKVNDAYNATNNGNTGFWWMVASDRAMPITNGYRIPAVYSDSRNGGYSSLSPLDIYYIDDIEVLNTEYTESIVSWDPNFCIIGIKEVTGTTISTVSQNFPNPFNGSTTVKVNLTSSELVTINVTNSIGQVVATKVVKGNVGNNEITIDGTNLNAGIYFYTVVAGNSKVTRKMSVVK